MIRMMRNIYDIPNKPIFTLSCIGALSFLIWMPLGDRIFGILSGIFLIIAGLFSIIRPHSMPRFKLMYGFEDTTNTFKISQRIFGFALIACAFYIVYIGRIQSASDIGVMIILIFGSFLASYIIYRKKHSANIDPAITSHLKFGIAGCIVFVVLGILFIIIKFPMESPGYPLLIGGLVGGVLGLLWQDRKAKKFVNRTELNNKKIHVI
jgi:hypothetical protein